MKLCIYMEYIADGHPICGYYDGIKDYEAQKRHCKRKGYKITKAYLCAFKTDHNKPFEWVDYSNCLADTKSIDC